MHIWNRFLHFISKLYPKYTIREKSIMRVTRNADIDAHDLYDEDMDYRDMMEQLIKKRVRLDPVRVELSRKINDEAKQELSNFLEIGTSHIINVKTPLDLSFVFTLQNYLRDQKELFYEKRSPRETPASEGVLCMCGMSSQRIDCFIKTLKEYQIDIPIKATVTATNQKWSFGALVEELNREHEAILKQQNSR